VKEPVPTWLLTSALAAGLFWAIWPPLPDLAVAASVQDDLPPPTRLLQWRGGASCAAAACHNANGPAGSKGSEYGTWIAQDPHARAYTILYDRPSRRIVTNLYRLPESAEPKPQEDGLCLRCHGISPEESQLQDRPALDTSLTCESCHGPAEKWLAQHYLPGFRQQSVRAKLAEGMNPTKDLLARVDACVGCHVGSADREVNHDLIAAGHPRLNFEYSSFLAVLPKHWDEREEKQRYPDLEVRTWAIGQAASARAALELLAARAAPTGKGPWPEFTEYDCFACHHELQGISWRQERDLKRSRAPVLAQSAPGRLPWGTWYVSMLPQAVAIAQPVGDSRLSALLDELRNEMSKKYPDPAHVKHRALLAADRLKVWSEALAAGHFADFELLNNLMASIARDDRKVAEANWDSAAQVYLALAAAYHAQGDLFPLKRNRNLRENLNSMVKLLQFDSGMGFKFDSPKERRYLDSETLYLLELRRFQEQSRR
jgi:hypothetical protein